MKGREVNTTAEAFLSVSKRPRPMACFQSTEQSSCCYCDGYRWVIVIRMSLSFFSVFFHGASKVIELKSPEVQPAQAFSFEVGDEEARRRADKAGHLCCR